MFCSGFILGLYSVASCCFRYQVGLYSFVFLVVVVVVLFDLGRSLLVGQFCFGFWCLFVRRISRLVFGFLVFFWGWLGVGSWDGVIGVRLFWVFSKQVQRSGYVVQGYFYDQFFWVFWVIFLGSKFVQCNIQGVWGVGVR